MRKILFIDRDGTLIVEPPDQQIDSLDKLEFIPGVFEALKQIVKSVEGLVIGSPCAGNAIFASSVARRSSCSR